MQRINKLVFEELGGHASSDNKPLLAEKAGVEDDMEGALEGEFTLHGLIHETESSCSYRLASFNIWCRANTKHELLGSPQQGPRSGSRNLCKNSSMRDLTPGRSISF